MKRRFLRALALLSLMPALALAGPDFPNKPVKLLISTSAGGPTDVLARAIADRLSRKWGQPVLVEAKPGGNGVLAIRSLLNAPADGYTLLLALSNIVQNRLTHEAPPYTMDQFTYIGQIATHPLAFVLSRQQGDATLDAFLKASASRQSSFGTWGVGSSGHIAGAVLARSASSKLLHVPYAGEPPTLLALRSAEIDAAFVSVGTARQQASAQTFTLVAVTGSSRSELTPAVPTFQELGYPEVSQLSGWSGIFASAKTERDITAKISEALIEVINDKGMRDVILQIGYTPQPAGEKQFTDFVLKEEAKWRKAIDDSGVKDK